MRHLLTLAGDAHEVGLTRPDGRYRLLFGDSAVAVGLEPLGQDRYRLAIDGTTTDIRLVTEGDLVHIHCDGAAWTIGYIDPIRRFGKGAAGAAEDVATAPMPGTVVALHVAAGQSVSRGETLVVIESMKLETAIKAWRDGVVEAVQVGQGSTFERGAVLLTLVPEGAAN